MGFDVLSVIPTRAGVFYQMRQRDHHFIAHAIRARKRCAVSSYMGLFGAGRSASFRSRYLQDRMNSFYPPEY